jgi:hypothetical protein
MLAFSRSAEPFELRAANKRAFDIHVVQSKSSMPLLCGHHYCNLSTALGRATGRLRSLSSCLLF